MRLKPAIVISFLAAVAVTGIAGEARAASAVAASVDNFGYCYRMQSAKAAAKCALRSCEQRSRQPCRLITSCTQGGHGAIFLRLLPGRTIEAIGAVCGARSRSQAFRGAARRCDRLAKSNECRGPLGSWFDKR